MKNYVFLLLLSLTFIGCAGDLEDSFESLDETRMKASELYVYSGTNRMNAPSRKAINWRGELGYSIPDDGRYLVYYYIRIDGNIPGDYAVHHPAKDYFPRTGAGKTVISDLNHGYITANAEFRSCPKFTKYIYSTDGSAIQSIIVEEPTLEDMIAANTNPNDDFTGYLEHKDELHFLWYACKKQDSDHLWHIDGILTTKDRTELSETDYGEEIIPKYEDYGMVDDEGSVVREGSVEVDVHQQEHQGWNEIKTSIHLRDTVDVEVFLPIDYQSQADDFQIRAGVDYAYITELLNSKISIGDTEYQMEVSITHEEAGIRIHVKPNREALKAARERYDDGLTFEVHSYVTPGIPTDVIWKKLKAATCTPTPYTKLYGQITSAYYPDERVEIK